MRVIKFRAWDIEDLCMYNWIDDYEFVRDAMPRDCGDEWTDRCILMQFTGLSDKNGKEIYEGDVVKTIQVGIGVVEWNNTSCCYDLIWKDNRGHEHSPNLGAVFNRGTSETIGNIYENENLIE